MTALLVFVGVALFVAGLAIVLKRLTDKALNRAAVALAPTPAASRAYRKSRLFALGLELAGLASLAIMTWTADGEPARLGVRVSAGVFLLGVVVRLVGIRIYMRSVLPSPQRAGANSPPLD